MDAIIIKASGEFFVVCEESSVGYFGEKLYTLQSLSHDGVAIFRTEYELNDETKYYVRNGMIIQKISCLTLDKPLCM